MIMVAAMKIGYVRTSTTDQKASLLAQEKTLLNNGCTQVFKEEKSGTNLDRPILNELLENTLKKDDILVVTTLSRLARNIKDLQSLLELIEAIGASLVILDLNIDSKTATGKLLLNIMSALNQFEVELMKERQTVGIQKAKADGKYKGRAVMDESLQQRIVDLSNKGNSREDVALLCKVGVATVYRILKQAKEGV